MILTFIGAHFLKESNLLILTLVLIGWSHSRHLLQTTSSEIVELPEKRIDARNATPAQAPKAGPGFMSSTASSLTVGGIALLIVTRIGVMLWSAKDFRLITALVILTIVVLAIRRIEKGAVRFPANIVLAGLTWVLLLAMITAEHQVVMDHVVLDGPLGPFLGDLQGTGILRFDQSGMDDAARWALENTPDNALFLVPPDQQSFRVKARRAIVVDFKAFAFQDDAMREWLERLRTVVGQDGLKLGYGYSQELRSAYSEQSLRDFQRVIDKYNVDFIIVPTSTHLPLSPAYRNDVFSVFHTTNLEPVYESASFNWSGPESVTHHDLAEVAPPLVVQGVRGDFSFKRIVTDDRSILRVLPVRANADGELVIQFGYSHQRNGFEIEMQPDCTLIMSVAARFSSTAEEAQLFVQDKTDSWQRSTTVVQGASWQEHTVSRTIRSSAVDGGMGIHWTPQYSTEWLEIADVRIFLIHSE